MSVLAKDLLRNVELSFQKYFYETLSPSYYINYSARRNEELEKRIALQTGEYWKWLEIHWLELAPHIHSVNRLQVNACTLIANDPLVTDLRKMRDDVVNQLNIDSIPLFDFSTDPENPVPVDNVLIPRFRGANQLPDEAEGTTQVFAILYNLYVFKESTLP